MMIDLERLKEAVTDNFLLKFFSVLFAIGLWAFVNLGARDAEKSLLVSLELRNVPEDLMITSSLVEGVDVRLRGPRTLIGPVDETRLGFALDLGRIRPGTSTFSVEPDQLRLPEGVRVTRLSPAEVTLQVERVSQRNLPVALSVDTNVPEGYRLVDPEIQPEWVRVIGPASEVKALTKLVTQPLALGAAVPEFEVALEFEGLSQFVRTVPPRVIARGRLEEIRGERVVPRVRVRVRNHGFPYRVEPSVVEVNLAGPERILSDLGGDNGVWVDAEGLGLGLHVLAVVGEYPPGVEIERLDPRTVTITLYREPAE